MSKWGTILALWVFVPALIIKTVMSLMSIVNKRFTAETVDGIPVGAFNEIAQAKYLTAFQLLGLAHLPAIAFGFVAAIWFRKFIPLAAGLLLAESLARRVLLGDNPLLWFSEGPKIGINLALIMALALAIVLSVTDRPGKTNAP